MNTWHSLVVVLKNKEFFYVKAIFKSIDPKTKEVALSFFQEDEMMTVPAHEVEKISYNYGESASTL